MSEFTATTYYVRYLLLGIAAFILADIGGFMRGGWGNLISATGCYVILKLAADASRYRWMHECYRRTDG